MPKDASYLGDYIQAKFVKVKDPHGETLTCNPGNLDMKSVSFPFHYEHVNEAIGTSKRAFQSWRKIPGSDRFAAIKRYRDLIDKRMEELAVTISFEIGKPLWESRQEIRKTLAVFDHYLKEGSQTNVESTIPLDETGIVGRVRYIPRGVMVILSPAYQPFYLPHSFLIPALIDGNVAVLKSSSHALLTGQKIAEIAHDAGLPGGVLNLIHGNAEIAQRLVSHKDIDGIFFTGPYERALKIQKRIAVDYWKLLVINVGGKNGVVLWDDCSYEKALYETLNAAYVTTGQRCSSTGTVIVHEKIFGKFLKDFHSLAKKCRIGYGLTEGSEAPFMGPLVSEAALEHYLRYQGMAVREGCEEIMRGKHLERSQRGYYVSPSVHLANEINPKSIYQTEKVPGPDLTIYKTNSLDEAAQILNMTNYGLVASVYSHSRKTYTALAEETRTGLLYWNYPTIARPLSLPYGGLKISGNNRPMGSFSHHQLTHPISSIECTNTEKSPDLPKELPNLD